MGVGERHDIRGGEQAADLLGRRDPSRTPAPVPCRRGSAQAPRGALPKRAAVLAGEHPRARPRPLRRPGAARAPPCHGAAGRRAARRAPRRSPRARCARPRGPRRVLPGGRGRRTRHVGSPPPCVPGRWRGARRSYSEWTTIFAAQRRISRGRGDRSGLRGRRCCAAYTPSAAGGPQQQCQDRAERRPLLALQVREVARRASRATASRPTRWWTAVEWSREVQAAAPVDRATVAPGLGEDAVTIASGAAAELWSRAVARWTSQPARESACASSPVYSAIPPNPHPPPRPAAHGAATDRSQAYAKPP